MVEKEIGNFIGWMGFKLNIEVVNGYIYFIDLGYWFREEFWGKGYVYELVVVCMDYVVVYLDFDFINVMVMIINDVLVKILNEKIGMWEIGVFEGFGFFCYFYEILKVEWWNRMNNE